jgi:MFS family permease
LLDEILSTSGQRKLSLMVFCYSLANSTIAIFLPAYYLKIGSGSGLVWIAEFLATQFIVIGLLPRLTWRMFPRHFEALVLAGFGLYAVYDLLLISNDNPILIGLFAGMSIGTFWPSFNLLQLRLTSPQNRTATINAISILVMTTASTLGPLIGAMVISSGGGFVNALLLSSGFYVLAIFAMRGFPFESVVRTRNAVSSTKSFKLFALAYTLRGLSDVSWFVYPIFVLSLTGSYIDLGIVASIASVSVALVSVVLGRIADSLRQSRFTFILIGVVLSCIWLALLPRVTDEAGLVAASIVSGVSGAFTSNIFSMLGDEHPREDYPLVTSHIEFYLNSGRILNLALMMYFMERLDFSGYFEMAAVILSFTIPIFYILQRMKIHKEFQVGVRLGAVR